MPTVNSPKVVAAIIGRDGIYPGDPDRVLRIVAYNNQFNGGLAFGLITAGVPLDCYHASPHCRNPRTIWDASGLTERDGDRVVLEPHRVVRASEIPECDFCRDGTRGPFDFVTHEGPWAHGCKRHWFDNRRFMDLGEGHGQLWVVQPE